MRLTELICDTCDLVESIVKIVEHLEVPTNINKKNYQWTLIHLVCIYTFKEK